VQVTPSPTGATTSSDPYTVEAIELLARILPDSTIAGCLTQNGLRTETGNFWTKEAVAAARNCRQIPRFSTERKRSEGWMTLTQAAEFAGISPKTLRRAVEKQEIQALHPLSRGPWVFNHADLDTAKAKEMFQRVRGQSTESAGPNLGQLPLSLSTT
jgi:hypothetical protein